VLFFQHVNVSMVFASCWYEVTFGPPVNVTCCRFIFLCSRSCGMLFLFADSLAAFIIFLCQVIVEELVQAHFAFTSFYLSVT
jgi:hypothetical protein